ncbi:ras-related protein Rab-32-like isoform X2 [Anopheles albimanus]|uniref:ras-related protein Rab-32-like isoform X2 n=1 Tax=Anopheles albimanus TaxID=7167 RepID=UPI00163E405F|nr:ras-related protein Rab-32-like isoform X2 [Anopheles albimanus]
MVTSVITAVAAARRHANANGGDDGEEELGVASTGAGASKFGGPRVATFRRLRRQSSWIRLPWCPSVRVEVAVGDSGLARAVQLRSQANMAASPAEKREHLYKILVIGELGTGKTSFIKRYVHQFFSQNYRATIGVDFALKVLNWDQNTIIRLQLWDIAGQERFGNMTRVYYKEAVGAFIVFDVTRSATFDAVIKWKQDLDSKVQLPDGKPIPCILLANKSDQQKQGIVTTPAKLDEYVKEHGFAGWFETSAKENVNIEEAAKSLVNKILMNDKMLNTGEIVDSERFALAGGGGGKADINPKKSCAC